MNMIDALSVHKCDVHLHLRTVYSVLLILLFSTVVYIMVYIMKYIIVYIMVCMLIGIGVDKYMCTYLLSVFYC